MTTWRMPAAAAHHDAFLCHILQSIAQGASSYIIQLPQFNLTSMMVVIREIVASPTKNGYPMTDPWDERFLYLLIYQLIYQRNQPNHSWIGFIYLLIYQRNQPFMYVETGLIYLHEDQQNQPLDVG